MKLLNSLLVSLVLALPLSVQAGEPENAPGLSVQLWSVRDALEKDFEGTLKTLAGMGFEAVEFAGNYGDYGSDGKALKAFLESIGLQASGAHTGFAEFSDEKFEATTQFHKDLGTGLLIVPMDGRAFSPDGVDSVVQDLNRLAGKLAPHGLRTGYHNHAQEMGEFGETTYWDYIASNTGQDVVMQQDVGWTTVAGKDPVEYVKRYPGRTVTTHYKAIFPEGTEGAYPIIGRDIIDWPALIEANKTVGGTQWIVVEQEVYPDGMTSLEAVRASFEGLKTFLD